MLADANGKESSNGASRALFNTSRAQDGLPMVASNGTHKNSAGSTNGSSAIGKEEALPALGPPQLPGYFGHDREEVTRILIQALTDLGYRAAAESVGSQSGYQLESPMVAAFRTAVVDGAWQQAEELLSGACSAGERQPAATGLVLTADADKNKMRIWLRQQKFLELLEQRQTAAALVVLRTELTPLCQDQHSKLHFLSSLLMCQSVEDLKAKAEWDGAHGQSRQLLLSRLSRCMSPSVMLPEHRLAVLLQQVKESQINSCFFHTNAESPSLYADHVCRRMDFPSESLVELDKHQGEIWQVAFSHNGTRLASCGQERVVIIWDTATFEIVHKLEAHEGGTGNLAWSPDDRMLVTCGRDRYARIWDTESGHCLKALERFSEPVSSCAWTSGCRTFITGSFDKDKGLCLWNVDGDRLFTWPKKNRIEDLALSRDGRWLVAMDDQKHLHVYNFVTRELEYEMDFKVRLTSVQISRDSRFLLINKTDGDAQLMEIATRDPIQKYSGASGGEYTIRSGFGGANESFVISGSDDGSICIWHKITGIPIERLQAHHPRCNAVAWNPTDPCMFASCGDDNMIRIWSNKDRIRARQVAAGQGGSNGWPGSIDKQEREGEV